jgi:acyl CoA:acetate/3-ketoacid CoA transferase beta subunit
VQLVLQSGHDISGADAYPVDDAVDLDLSNAGEKAPRHTRAPTLWAVRMIRAGKVDAAILNTTQASADGDLAN